MNRYQYNLESILKEIEGSPNGVGFDVSLSRVYDEIKDAKFEEDDSVSFGIWERELKKADWAKAEQLCVEALEKQSKDLQIVGWLMETLTVLDGFDGILDAINILYEFISKFWEASYPRTEDNTSDQEQKLRILNWIYSVLEKRSKFTPFIKDSSGISIYSYDYAVEMKNTIIRAPNLSTEVLNSANKAHMKTLEEIQNIINITPVSEFEQTTDIIERIKSVCEKLKESLQNFVNDPDPVFPGLLNNLEKVKKIISLKNKNTSKEPDHPQAEIYKTSERDAIYDEINMLAQRLAVIEKHSPSSFILNLVVSWKNKSLLEVIEDIKTGTTESHKLLKFLVS